MSQVREDPLGSFEDDFVILLLSFSLSVKNGAKADDDNGDK